MTEIPLMLPSTLRADTLRFGEGRATDVLASNYGVYTNPETSGGPDCPSPSRLPSRVPRVACHDWPVDRLASRPGHAPPRHGLPHTGGGRSPRYRGAHRRRRCAAAADVWPGSR